MRCTNPACNREHFSHVRFCPYCGSQQPLESTALPEPVQTGAPPAPDTSAPPAVLQYESPARTDDEQADDELWEKARSLDTIRVYEQYLHTNTPFKKRHLTEAEQRFEQLEKQEKDKDKSLWQQASSENTVKAYKGYLGEDLYAKLYTGEAEQRIKALESRIDVSEAPPKLPEPTPPPPVPPRKWRQFALIGAALMVAYVIWANLGTTKPGDTGPQDRTPPEPTLSSPPPLVPDISKRQQEERRCATLVKDGWSSLNQRPNSDYERAIAQATEAQSILSACPGAAELLKQASGQRDFFITERLRKEREDSVNLDRCQVMMAQGNQALQMRRYDQALRYAASAKSIYAKCPGIALLEQEANTAITATDQSADAGKRNQCESLVEAGKDALLRRDYGVAVRNATQANRLYPGCPGSGDLENSANEAICTQLVVNGQEALKSGRYSQAVTFSRRAINTYARCPGAESLEQEASIAMNAAKGISKQANQEKARVRCEALVDAGRDALQSASYDQAINSARRAKQAYSLCPGADALERGALEAKRKAREGTTIF